MPIGRVTVVRDDPACIRCCGCDIPSTTASKRRRDGFATAAAWAARDGGPAPAAMRRSETDAPDAPAPEFDVELGLGPWASEYASEAPCSCCRGGDGIGERRESTGNCACLRTCARRAWSGDAVLTPDARWYSGKTVVFVGDTHLCCGFDLERDPSTALDVSTLDGLMSETLGSLGDRVVYTGDVYEMWCAVAGSLPLAKGARRALGIQRPARSEDADAGATRTSASASSSSASGWATWSSPSWAAWAFGPLAVDPSRRSRAPRMSAERYLRGSCSAAAGDAVDRCSAIVGASVGCCALEPWDALFPAIVDTWPSTHRTLCLAALDGRAVVLAGNHDAAIARCLAVDGASLPRELRRDGTGGASAPPGSIGVPCYNSVEFGGMVRAEHGHRRDTACDDRSVLSRAVSCAGCLAGHWKSQGLARASNAVLRTAYRAFSATPCGMACDWTCFPLAQRPRVLRGGRCAGCCVCCASADTETGVLRTCSSSPCDSASRGTVDRHEARRAAADGAMATPSPSGPLRIVLFGHTHLKCVAVVGAGALYVNAGNSARPVRRVVGASLDKLQMRFFDIVNRSRAGNPLARDELDSLTIDVARIAFDADGRPESAEVGTVNLVTKVFSLAERTSRNASWRT